MKVLKANDFAMQAKIEKAHAEAIELLKQKYTSPESLQVIEKADRILKVEFSNRMTTRGGVAMLRRIGRDYEYALIRLNFRLHELHPEELIPTYLHELAHIIANFMLGRNCGHDGYWAMVMKVFGLAPERCHKMDVSSLARTPKRFAYTCVKCQKEYKLTTHKHKRNERAKAQGAFAYRCKCFGALNFKGEAS